MEIETLDVRGFGPAIVAMRNPMSSWAKSDSNGDAGYFRIGEKDKELSIKLQKAGPEHCKHLRMVMCWANISASLCWWKQMDCYRAGVEKVSTSTMHKIMSRLLSLDDFAETPDGCMSEHMMDTVMYLNELIKAYQEAKDPTEKKILFDYVIQALPQSYIQKRTVMMSYAALRNIYRQR